MLVLHDFLMDRVPLDTVSKLVISSDELDRLLEMLKVALVRVELEVLLKLENLPLDQIVLKEFGFPSQDAVVALEVRERISICLPQLFYSSAELFEVQSHQPLVYEVLSNQVLCHILGKHDSDLRLSSVGPTEPISTVHPDKPMLFHLGIHLALESGTEAHKVCLLVSLQPLEVICASSPEDVVVVVFYVLSKRIFLHQLHEPLG